MIDQLLEVLNSEPIMKKIHAKKIDDVYQEKINEKTPCETCWKGMARE